MKAPSFTSWWAPIYYTEYAVADFGQGCGKMCVEVNALINMDKLLILCHLCSGRLTTTECTREAVCSSFFFVGGGITGIVMLIWLGWSQGFGKWQDYDDRFNKHYLADYIDGGPVQWKNTKTD